jgi:hypothetical protein
MEVRTVRTREWVGKKYEAYRDTAFPAAVNLLIVCLIVYVLLWLPIKGGLAVSKSEQFQWNVFALAATLWVSYKCARAASKREVLREAQATARGALRRILQARSGSRSVLGKVDQP